MKVSCHIITGGKTTTKLTNDFEQLDLNVEYAVPTNNLFISYKSEEDPINKGLFSSYRKSYKRINHIIHGNVKHKDLDFELTIGVVFEKGEIFHIILSQESNNGNYFIEENHYLPEYNVGGYEILDIDEYIQITKLEKEEPTLDGLLEQQKISCHSFFIKSNRGTNLSDEAKFTKIPKKESEKLKVDQALNFVEYKEIVEFINKYDL